MPASENWSIHQEGGHLVFRNHGSEGDHRVAIAPGTFKTYGAETGIRAPGANKELLRTDGWVVQEEKGWLVFRDTHTSGDHRVAFHPGNSENFGHPHEPSKRGGGVIASGLQWDIQEENGVLVFRDKLTGGDHRYAFYPSCGNGVNLA